MLIHKQKKIESVIVRFFTHTFTFVDKFTLLKYGKQTVMQEFNRNSLNVIFYMYLYVLIQEILIVAFALCKCVLYMELMCSVNMYMYSVSGQCVCGHLSSIVEFLNRALRSIIVQLVLRISIYFFGLFKQVVFLHSPRLHAGGLL